MGNEELKIRKNRFNLSWFITELENKAIGIEYISDYHRYSLGKAVFECKEHGRYISIPHLVIKRNGNGCPSCTELSRRKPVCGVGNNDVLGYDRKDYYLWYNVVRRGTVPLKNYDKVKCHKDWLTFSNFLKDLPLIDNFIMREKQGWELDKDLLSDDNKIYSKDTTCFLPREINASIAIGEDEYNITGVMFDKEINKFFAYVVLDGKRRRFGSFTTIKDAHNKYVELKRGEVLRLAEKYKSNLTDRVYDALKSWHP